MMRRLFAVVLALFLLLTGCAARAEEAPKGDFSFSLPQGYRIEEEADSWCTIIREEDDAKVGGLETTAITPKELKKNGTEEAPRYLQEEFYKTNEIEYLASYWGKENPVVTVSLKKQGQWEFSHMFFAKEDCVYHVWFYLELIAREDADRFLSITGLR